MADFDDIDALLSSSLKKAAEPANSAGVADAIRSRVAAGDAGTAVAGATAPGWGGGASGILTIVAPIALIVVAGVVGGALGASGVFGSPAGPPDGNVPAYVITPDTAPAYACPGGLQLGSLPANSRVLAVARDADSEWLGVRDPADLATVIWLPVGDVVLDENATDTSTLPVMACDEATVTVVTPSPEPTQEPTPEPTKPPAPPAPTDTTPPSAGKMSATPQLVINNQGSLISVSASDNVAVTGVALTWAGPNGLTGSAPMTLVGSTWRYTWSYNDNNIGFGNWTFTARASDAAGNHSSPVQVVINRQYLG